MPRRRAALRQPVRTVSARAGERVVDDTAADVVGVCHDDVGHWMTGDLGGDGVEHAPGFVGQRVGLLDEVERVHPGTRRLGGERRGEAAIDFRRAGRPRLRSRRSEVGCRVGLVEHERPVALANRHRGVAAALLGQQHDGAGLRRTGGQPAGQAGGDQRAFNSAQQSEHGR
jgi:hypothetical protein